MLRKLLLNLISFIDFSTIFDLISPLSYGAFCFLIQIENVSMYLHLNFNHFKDVLSCDVVCCRVDELVEQHCVFLEVFSAC